MIDYLSYSGFKSFQDCPAQYQHKYLYKTPTPPSNRVNMLYGDVVGKLFEIMYAEQLYSKFKLSRALCGAIQDRAKKVLALVIQGETAKGGEFRFDDPTLHEEFTDLNAIYSLILESIPRGLNTLGHHGLINPTGQAEIKLDKSHTLGDHTIKVAGRADFIVQIGSERVIVDGKGTRHGSKYLNTDQLYWYSWLSTLWGERVDRVGFLYWREEDPVKGLKWIQPTEDKIRDLIDRVTTTVIRLNTLQDDETLPTKPGAECRFCDYKSICPDAMLDWPPKRKSGLDGLDADDIAV